MIRVNLEMVLKIEYEGDPYEIVTCQHVKPGKGVAFVKTRMKISNPEAHLKSISDRVTRSENRILRCGRCPICIRTVIYTILWIPGTMIKSL